MSESAVPSLKRQLLYYWKGFSKQIILGASAIVLIDASELWLPVLLRDTVDAFSAGIGSAPQKNLLIKGLFLVVTLQVFGRYLWRVALSKSSMLAGAGLRKEFADQSFRISIPKMEEKKVGELMTLATSDIENMRFALGPAFIAVIDAVFYCISLPIAMFMIAPALAWKVILPVLMIPLVVIILQGRIALQSKKVQEQLGRLGTLTQEMISGIRLIKTYGLKEEINQKLKKESHSLNERMVNMIGTQARLNPSMEFFLSASMVVLFATPAFSIGTLVAMQRYLQRLLWPLSASAMAVVYFQKAKSSGDEYYQYVDETDIEAKSDDSKTFETSPETPLIEAKNLEFSYPAGKKIIQNLDLKIFEGEWVGISGPVGSGKSTFLQLLMKFYPVEKGKLFINGQDVTSRSHDWVRSHFAPVMQDPYLFQGTLLENLSTSGEEQPLSWSMKVSGLHEDEFMKRLDQKIGERGVGLSGGQKQRVAIARALHKNAPILLLDDPLSSVDSVTAEHVLNQMSEEIRKLKKTVIFVSHHDAHLKYCDRVVRL